MEEENEDPLMKVKRMSLKGKELTKIKKKFGRTRKKK